MLLSSPQTHSLKKVAPAVVFGVCTLVVLWVQRNEITSAPLMTLSLLIAVYACAAWTLWRPFDLRIADSVTDYANTLVIRRGDVELRVSYSDVKGIELLTPGISAVAKLTFTHMTRLGPEVGFYLGEASDPGTNGQDPLEYLRSRIRPIS